ILGIVGILANVLNILVLFRHSLNDSISVVLFGTAVSDLIYSLNETLNRLIAIIGEVFGYDLTFDAFSFFYVYLRYISPCAITISAWLVALVSMERMFAVCFPFHASRIITVKRMTFMVLFVYVFLVFLNSPAIFDHYLTSFFYPVSNYTGEAMLERKFFMDNPWFETFFYNEVLPVVGSPLPMIAILVFTLATIIRLGVSSKTIGNMSTSRAKRAKEMTSIKISLAISCSMVLLIFMPRAGLDAYYKIMDRSLLPHVWAFYNELTELARQLNATINFFIYVAFSSKFQKTFLKVIQCKYGN
ncbi:unnamed protein product, partial [Lymnaea stagnalis]